MAYHVLSDTGSSWDYGCVVSNRTERTNALVIPAHHFWLQWMSAIGFVFGLTTWLYSTVATIAPHQVQPMMFAVMQPNDLKEWAIAVSASIVELLAALSAVVNFGFFFYYKLYPKRAPRHHHDEQAKPQ